MKLTTVIKFGYLAALMFCTWCPNNALGDDGNNPLGTQNQKPPPPLIPDDVLSGGKNEKQDKDKTPPPKKEFKEEETIITNLFNNATYENFGPQEENEVKIVDKQYLEP